MCSTSSIVRGMPRLYQQQIWMAHSGRRRRLRCLEALHIPLQVFRDVRLPVRICVVARIHAPFMGDLIRSEEGQQVANVTEFAIAVPGIPPQAGPICAGHVRYEVLQHKGIVLEDDWRVQSDGAEQTVLCEQHMDGPAAAPGEPSQRTMVTIRKRTVVLIHECDDVMDQTIAKAIARRKIPIAVIWEDDNEWRRLVRVDEVVGRYRCAQLHPLVILVGLAMK